MRQFSVRMRVVVVQGSVAALAVWTLIGLGDPTGRAISVASAVAQEDVTFGPRSAIPKATCQEGDAPETDLQGRTPPQDILTGRAAQGYRCNLELVGQFPSSTFTSFDSYGDCAHFGRAVGAGGTQVLDVSDPALPVPTTVLTTPAMQDPWESLRAHAGRGLLVADSQFNGYLDIYDVSSDCTQPVLLSSTDLSPAIGHEGWFSPDGLTYYMSTTAADGVVTTFPVDISDPAQPRLLATWAFHSQTHGGWTTEDGTRSYICQQQAPPNDALLVVDTTTVTQRAEEPKPELLAAIPLGDNQWCQSAYRVTYDGHPYLIQYGERGAAPDCSRAADGWATHAYPRIYDLADERNPVLVSEALLEVDLPEHCETVTGEGTRVSEFGYSVHHCAPDRLYDPTILACSYFGAGLRVLDIRDPHRPVELAYYKVPHGALGTIARPVVRAERGEIWFVADVFGLQVVRFADGVWPFPPEPPCPEFDDFWYAAYNPGSACPTANRDGIGRPAPSGQVPLPRERHRIDGGGASDPVGQAVATSRARFGDGEAARVVLATADRFPDALSGAPLAGAEGPVLLTPSGATLDPRAAAEIARVTGGDGVVVTLGGPAAVSEDAAVAARAAGGDRPCAAPLPSGCRLRGAVREETAAAVAAVVRAEHPDAPDLALVARSDDFADAVTGGAFAAGAGVPLLLTPTDRAHPATVAWLEGDVPAGVVVLGGTAAVSDATLGALPGAERTRVAGSDRVATSVAIATELWRDVLGAGRGGAALVNVRHPDAWQTALTAAVASARLDLPQLGVESPPAAVAPSVRDHLASVQGSVMVFGDRALVSDEQVADVAAARPRQPEG